MHNWSQYGFLSCMGFIWIPFVTLIIWMLFHLLSKDRDNRFKKDSPLEILERHYAEGEISSREFEESKKALSPEN